MTFREKSITRLYAFALAAVFALVLAGCGGGGGTADTPDPGTTPEMCPEGHTGTPPNCMSPEQVEAAALAAAKTAAATAASNAASAVAAVMDNSGLAPEAYASAQAAVAVANQANSAAQAATTSAAAQAAQAIAESAASDAAMYAGMVTAAKTAADANAARMAANAVAKTKEDAIATELAENTADTPNNAGLGGTGAPTTTDGSEGEYTLAISRDRMATKVSITVEGATNDDDEMFMQAMDLGGGRTMHTRAMDADDDGNVVDEVVIVSTDIEAPTAVAFAKFEEMDGTMSQTLDARADGKTVDADNPADSRDLGTALDTSVAADAVVLGRVKSSAFAGPGDENNVLTFGGDDPADEDDAAYTTAGTFNGAMGMYMCAGGATDCTVTLDGDGKITNMSDGWIFTPAEGAMSDQPDYDYLHYGFWLKRTTKDGAVTSYTEVETFAGSSVAASGDVSSVTGSATYEGGAVGVYVKNVYNSDRTLDTASSGHFTADVSLTATFGQVPVSATDTTGTIAPNLLNTVSGTINKFMLSGGEENMWSVAVAGTITPTDGTASGTAKGGDGDGLFSATFHGSVAAGTDGTVPQPGSIVGEFNAGFTDGSVAGAFGARKMDE